MTRLAALALAALVACGSTVVDPPAVDPPAGGAGGAPTCSALLADCDGDGSCETNLHTLESCGACGAVCAAEHASASCLDGVCSLSCAPGWADCDGDGANGCEAHLASDAGSCGACGASCGAWGDCLEGVCVDVLASVLGVDGVAALGAQIYWSALDPYAGPNGAVQGAPETGGLPLTLAKQSAPAMLRAAAAGLVWVDHATDTVWRAEPSGLLAPLFTAPDAAVIGASDADAFVGVGGDVLAIPLAGGPPILVASGLVEPSAALLVGGALYLADVGPALPVVVDGFEVIGNPEGAVLRVDLASGAVTPVAQHLDAPSALAVAGGALFWAESGSLATYLVGDADENHGTLGRVVRASLDGSGAAPVAEGLAHPAALAADAEHLWIASVGTVGGASPSGGAGWEPDGGLGRVPLSGGAYERLLPVDARGLALTEHGVVTGSWWLGLVVRLAK